MFSRIKRNLRTIWLLSFLPVASTWLLAPYLNKLLLSKTATISDYKSPGFPYWWLFAVGDALAGILLVLISSTYLKKHLKNKTIWRLGAVMGVLLLFDSLFPETCSTVQGVCKIYFSPSLLLHTAESLVLGLIVFFLSTKEALRSKSILLTAFSAYQLLYGASVLVLQHSFPATYAVLQYAYQIAVVVWIGTWVAKCLPEPSRKLATLHAIRYGLAFWAFVSGVLAMASSFLRTRHGIHAPYFGDRTAWLAQHSALSGLIMVYVSSKLARGEYRARLLFLGALFLLVIHNSLVDPRPIWLCIYGAMGIVLISFGQLFKRNSKSVSWLQRLQDASTLLLGLIGTVSVLVVMYARDQRFARIVKPALSELGEQYGFAKHVTAAPLRSSLLEHTITALAVGALLLLFWTLFRPAKLQTAGNNGEQAEIEALLQSSSQSSEDYFKVWPEDKQYFWNTTRSAFVAYKVAGSVAYALADPIGPTKSTRKAVLEAFLQYCNEHGYAVSFLAIDEANLSFYERASLRTLQIGSHAVIDVALFSGATVRDKWWRWQMNRATKQGYVFHCSTPPHADALISGVKKVSDAWLSRDGRMEQGFALGYFDTDYINKETLYYVTDAYGTMIAFANKLPTYNNQEQASVDLIRFEPSHNNVMPFLLANVLLHIHERQVSKFDLGFVPLAQTDTQIMKAIKYIARRRYSAAGLEQFKNKFDPLWHKDYMAYTGNVTDLAAIALNLNEVMRAPED